MEIIPIFFREYRTFLNEYQTDLYFLQIFKSNTTVCLIIYAFCKSCEFEIVQKKLKQKTTQESKQKQFQVHNHVRKSYKMRKSTLLCIGNLEENIYLSRIYLAVHNCYCT
jgi:translation elongation factor EF-1alpha